MGVNVVYGSEAFKAVIEEGERSVTEARHELRVETYPNALVLPYAEPADLTHVEIRTVKNRIGGVFDKNGDLVELSKTLAGKNSVRAGRPARYVAERDIAVVDKDVVYIGYLLYHFGHFITESLGRLWVYLDEAFKNKTAVYISERDTPFIKALELFGLDRKNVKRITEPTRFRTVTIPESAILVEDGVYHAKQNLVLKKIREASPGKNHDKIYLSRTRLREGVRVYGEKVIERAFADNGFKIVHPERLSMAEQISLMKNCRHLAGVAGSALHLSVFAGDAIEVTCINRMCDSFPIQLMINGLKGIKYSSIEAWFSCFPSVGNETPHMLRFSRHLYDYFKDRGFELSGGKRGEAKEFLGYLEDWLVIANRGRIGETQADRAFSFEDFKTRVLSVIDAEDLEKRYVDRKFPRWKRILVRIASGAIPIKGARKKVRRKLSRLI